MKKMIMKKTSILEMKSEETLFSFETNKTSNYFENKISICKRLIKINACSPIVSLVDLKSEPSHTSVLSRFISISLTFLFFTLLEVHFSMYLYCDIPLEFEALWHCVLSS